MIELMEICLVLNFFTLILEIVIHIIQEVVLKFLDRQKLLWSQRISNVDVWKQLFGNCLIEQVHLITLILGSCQHNMLSTKGQEHNRTGETENHGSFINFVLLFLSHLLHCLHLVDLLFILPFSLLLKLLILNFVLVCLYMSFLFFWVTQNIV